MTYKFDSLAREPIDDGMVPLNWLLCKTLFTMY